MSISLPALPYSRDALEPHISATTARPHWAQVREWRKSTRTDLLAARRALSRTERQRCAAAVASALQGLKSELVGRRVGFYWPLKGEIDLVRFMRGMLRELEAAALPVIVQKSQPLEFWNWNARTQLCSHGIWNIPSPAERVLVEPDVLLVPLLGFDAAGFRLGYGGGYYDRTLAALQRRPRLIAVGHEFGRLTTIYPQPHDIPMDAVVTENGLAHGG